MSTSLTLSVKLFTMSLATVWWLTPSNLAASRRLILDSISLAAVSFRAAIESLNLSGVVLPVSP
jgi:hypothetical protein